MANYLQEGGDQFYSALQQKAQAAVASIFNSPLRTIQYPSQGDFMWNWSNANQVFNQSTFDYISAILSKGDFTNSAKMGSSGSFANAYSQMLNVIVYSLSAANQQKLIQAQNNASTQAMTIISDYQTTYGPITDAMMQTAGVATKQDYVISYIMGSVWSGKGTSQPLTYTQMAAARNLAALMPNMPASGNQVLTDVTIYLNIMQPVNALSDMLQNGAWILRQLKTNTQYPSSNNGGMQTVNPVTGVVSPQLNVGYGINYSQAAISNDLQNTARTISLGMTTSSASGGSLNVNVEGQAGFSVGSFLKFSVAGGATYDMSQVNGTSTDCSVSMLWKGYSMIPMAPLAWQQATSVGWYYGDPITQAMANGQQDVDGFKFISTPPYNLGKLDNGGTFGQFTNLLIANYPTITITYRNANFSAFQQAWSEHVSGNLTLFGFISLGSFSQGAYGSSYQQGADNSTFSVTFSASPQVTSVPQLQQTAYVVAGAVNTPSGN
jgi:hypothetical protein